MSRRARRIAALVIVGMLLVGTGCAGNDAPPAAPVPPATTPSPQPGSAAEQTCGVTAPAGTTVEDLTLPAPDGVTLTAAAVGDGPTGVVLLHQTNNGLCGWLPYALRLAGEGFSVLAFDQRCTFGSTCVEGEQQHNLLGDVRAAVATLKKRGAAEVAVVGASLGGAVAIGACAEVAVDRCAALSAAVFDRKLGGGVTASTAIGQVRRPLLYAVAPDDSSSSLEDGRSLVGRARTGVVTFVELPAGAGHGWDTVVDPADPTRPSAFAAQLETFLRG